jgi:hypothetical protein
LPVQIGLVVPSKGKDGTRISDIDFAIRVEREQKWFDSKFGGDTSFKTEGGYVDEKKRLKEDTVLVTSSTTVPVSRRKGIIVQSYQAQEKAMDSLTDTGDLH